MTDPAAALRQEMLALLPRLRRFARSLTANPADADDLVQDTVERALKRLSTFEMGTRLDSWMYRIAQNLWIDRRRAARVRDAVSGEGELEHVAGAGGEAAAEAHIEVGRLAVAMKALPDDQRAAVSLVLIEGLSYRDASAVLGVPQGTLTSRLARGRAALAAAVMGAAT
jgi:RNA polymerase sigma-70 factor (ECF subfamily)